MHALISGIFWSLLVTDVRIILQGSRHKVRYDGMMHYMTILKTREYETGQVRVVTKNSEGEAEAYTNLTVVPKDDWRSKLRQAPKGMILHKVSTGVS